jgi:Fe-S-cluster-containing dehydrogenase component
MTQKEEKAETGRRNFLRTAGKAAVAAAALVGGKSIGAQETPAKTDTTSPVEGYDWNEHNWGYGIDAYRCIGCLRCVEACKTENGVAGDAHHFRTWVERYVYVEGEERARVDSHSDPDNIAASGSEKEYRFDNRYKDEKVEKAFFVPKMCNHCSRPSCVQVCPTGATYKTRDGAVLIDHTHCIGCQYCVQACPYGARFFNVEDQVTEKCTWCYHRITKGLNPACVEVCPTGARIFGDMNDEESPISAFLRDNRVMVLKPEQGNAPTCFYIGIDKEVS